MTIWKVDNIPIWGDHDERTIDQIRRCAADEHLGYAMPIGGIVAYREALSPSGGAPTPRRGAAPVPAGGRSRGLEPPEHSIAPVLCSCSLFGAHAPCAALPRRRIPARVGRARESARRKKRIVARVARTR